MISQHDERNEPMEIDYGPLVALIGNWKGDKGVDVAPEPDGSETNPYFETLAFAAAGDATNAEKQKLAVVRYHQVVRRKSDGEIFHDQVGYWMWDGETGIVMQSLTIPRAVCVLAGGYFSATGDQAGAVTLEVAARLEDLDWGIIQSPFMRDHARTLEFRHKLSIRGDELTYAETTVLDIYGRKFDHTDENVLVRC
jgi:hypothetical protein